MAYEFWILNKKRYDHEKILAQETVHWYVCARHRGKVYNTSLEIQSRPDISVVQLLPNQTWVHSPVHSKANLLTPGCGERKCSIYCRAPSKESRAASAQTT